MGESSLSVIKVLTIICTAGVATVHWANPSSWARVRVWCADFSEVIVIRTACGAAGSPIQRCVVFVVAISSLHQAHVHALGSLKAPGAVPTDWSRFAEPKVTHDLWMHHGERSGFLLCEGWLTAVQRRAEVDVQAVLQERAACVAYHVVASLRFLRELIVGRGRRMGVLERCLLRNVRGLCHV